MKPISGSEEFTLDQLRAIDCVISRYLFKHKDDRIWRNGQIAIPRWTRNQWYVAILLSAMTRRGWKVTIGSRRLYRPKKKTRRRKYRPKNKIGRAHV